MNNNVIAGCGSGAVLLASIPTIGLIISEVLGMSTGKSNGIIHFIICIVKKIINKEPITSADLLQCLSTVEQAVEQIGEAEEVVIIEAVVPDVESGEVL